MTKSKAFLKKLWAQVKNMKKGRFPTKPENEGGSLLQSALASVGVGRQQSFVSVTIHTEQVQDADGKWEDWNGLTVQFDSLDIVKYSIPGIGALGAELTVDVCSGSARDLSALLNKLPGVSQLPPPPPPEPVRPW